MMAGRRRRKRDERESVWQPLLLSLFPLSPSRWAVCVCGASAFSLTLLTYFARSRCCEEKEEHAPQHASIVDGAEVSKQIFALIISRNYQVKMASACSSDYVPFVQFLPTYTSCWAVASVALRPPCFASFIG